MIEYDLQVPIKGTISFVQLKLIPLDTSLNQCLRFAFNLIIGQSMKKGKASAPQLEARKRCFECLRVLHKYVIKDNIIECIPYLILEFNTHG